MLISESYISNIEKTSLLNENLIAFFSYTKPLTIHLLNFVEISQN